MLIGVRGSWNSIDETKMVTISLKIPQMLSVTTVVRCKSANSEAVIRKAKIPGSRMMPIPCRGPLSSVRILRPSRKAPKPSTGMAMMARLVNMTGAR